MIFLTRDHCNRIVRNPKWVINALVFIVFRMSRQQAAVIAVSRFDCVLCKQSRCHNEAMWMTVMADNGISTV